MYQNGIFPNKVGMRVCHFKIEHLDGARLGAKVCDGGGVVGLRNARFRRLAIALEQQLPALT